MASINETYSHTVSGAHLGLSRANQRRCGIGPWWTQGQAPRPALGTSLATRSAELGTCRRKVTATGEALAAAAACMIPFEPQTERGSTLTLIIRFPKSNVRTPILAAGDMLESGVPPTFTPGGGWLECPQGRVHMVNMQRIRWLRARRQNERMFGGTARSIAPRTGTS